MKKNKTQSPYLNARNVVKHFGGRTPVYNLLKESGCSLSKKAIEHWQERGNIPTDKLVQLCHASKTILKKQFDINTFIELK